MRNDSEHVSSRNNTDCRHDDITKKNETYETITALTTVATKKLKLSENSRHLHTCNIIENCMTRGCNRPDSCCCLWRSDCGACIEWKCRGECCAMNSPSSAVVPRLILLDVRVTRNSLQKYTVVLLTLISSPQQV